MSNIVRRVAVLAAFALCGASSDVEAQRLEPSAVSSLRVARSDALEFIRSTPDSKSRVASTVIGAVAGAFVGALIVRTARKPAECDDCATNYRNEAWAVVPALGAIAGGAIGWWWSGRGRS